MPAPRPDERDAARIAAATAALMLAQHVAGKATRDAFFLSTYGADALPALIALAALVSVALVPPLARALARRGPARLVPPAFAASAIALALVWALARGAPRAAAVALYLHVAAVNAVLISWFWSLVNERFDPRTARREMRRIGGGAALGGLAGGLIAERGAALLGVAPMPLALAALHALCALAALRLRRPGAGPRSTRLAPPVSGFAVLRRSAYARDLAALVVVSTVAATLVDFVFKSGASAAYERGPAMMRFFAAFYAASGLATLLAQTLLGHLVLARFGIAPAAASLPAAVLAGSLGAIALPGLPSAAALRGAEMAFHSSLFRSGYELFFAPLPAREKRGVKTIIDVGFERLGDALGGALLALALPFLAPSPRAALLAGAAALSALALVLTARLHRGHRRLLEHNLRERAVELDLDDVHESTTTSVLLSLGDSIRLPPTTQPASPEPSAPAPDDPLAERIAALGSGDATRVRRALEGPPLPPSLVPHVIPLLAWDALAPAALAALRSPAAEAVEPLVGALLSPDEEFAIRRRVPRILEIVGGERAVEGLLRGLEDARFEVRYRCGRALARLRARAPDDPPDRERVVAAVLREARLDRGVWEGQRLLDADDLGGEAPEAGGLDELVRARAGRSLEHVFTLLSLAFPSQPLLLAFRGLHAHDPSLRGLALEYLESALPPEVRSALWPYLEDGPPASRPSRPREQLLQALLASHESIQVDLEQLRRLRE
jgi:ATP:ADP antiporter, AAA family